KLERLPARPCTQFENARAGRKQRHDNFEFQHSDFVEVLVREHAVHPAATPSAAADLGSLKTADHKQTPRSAAANPPVTMPASGGGRIPARPGACPPDQIQTRFSRKRGD